MSHNVVGRVPNSKHSALEDDEIGNDIEDRTDVPWPFIRRFRIPPMTNQEDRNGLQLQVVEATAIDSSDLSGAVRRGAPVRLELDPDREAVRVTRGDGKVIIARLKDEPGLAHIVKYLQAGHMLTGRVEAMSMRQYSTVLRIRLDH